MNSLPLDKDDWERLAPHLWQQSYKLDTPGQVSPEYLKRKDQDPPGTWLAQPKMDGWRRLVVFENGQWRGVPRQGGTGDNAKPLPPCIMRALEGSPWLKELRLDCEWIGPRGGSKGLCVFDHLGEDTFSSRYDDLLQFGWPYPAIQLLPCWGNPGLSGRFLEQLQDPHSEGLVVRRADSRLTGGQNPLWFKVKFRKGGVK